MLLLSARHQPRALSSPTLGHAGFNSNFRKISCMVHNRRMIGCQCKGRATTLYVVSAKSGGNGPTSKVRQAFDSKKNVIPFVENILKPLRDFGIGKTSMIQGGVGLFVFAGVGFALMLVSWARGGQLGRRGQGYQAILEFPVACGISVGTPVRIRGVPVGGVLSVQPSLEKVDVLVEMRDTTTVIPRNSKIEANQSGLIAEPLIDITPQIPVPDYVANPLDEDCEAEGKVVCHQGRIKGQRGVALDDLVYVCTKLANQMDAQGIDSMFAAMNSAQSAIEEAQPLLKRAVELTDEVIPLLVELRQGGLVGNVEALTQVAAEAAADIQRLQTEVLTENNVKALRESVQTLTKTLQHVERITGDLGNMTSDKKVTSNLKQLIESLSRIVVD